MKRSRALRAAAALIAVAAAAPAAHAQDAAGARAAIEAIPFGTRVRIETAAVHIGRRGAMDRDSVAVAERDAIRTLAFADVRGIAVATRNTAKGAAIGGTLGGVLIGGSGFLLASAFCDAADCGRAKGRATVIGGVIGAAGGALIGAGIGALSNGWKRVYP